ncbi:MAG: hypothetical protein HQL65_13240 [Magnetococcales bacterium]|nr:hypothetical protein [Magnetococcales bacterium]
MDEVIYFPDEIKQELERYPNPDSFVVQAVREALGWERDLNDWQVEQIKIAVERARHEESVPDEIVKEYFMKRGVDVD